MTPVEAGVNTVISPVEWLSDCTTDEKEWIERCAKKDPKAQQWVFKHFFGLAMGICVRYLSVHDLAQEAVSDSFLKIFDQLPRQVSEIRSFRAWLRAVVVRTAIDYFRKEKKNFAVTSLDAVYEHAEVEEEVISNQSVADILRLLDKLPPIWKVVFNLYEVEGYSHEEIGKMLSVTASSSRVYLAKGKQSLRKMIAIQNGSN